MRPTICCFCILILVGCENHNPVLTTNKTELTSQNAIDGKWAEDFIWYSLPFPNGISEATKGKTSTLTLHNSEFTVSILPPQAVMIPGSSSTLSSDTMYTGTFDLTQDTISFLINGQTDPLKFLFSTKTDSIFFSAITQITSDSVQHYFLWANSATKTAGGFKRLN